MRYIQLLIAALAIGVFSHALAVDPPSQQTSAPTAPASLTAAAPPQDPAASAEQAKVEAKAKAEAQAKSDADAKAKAIDKRLRAAGYKPMNTNGTMRYCKSEQQLGSRFEELHVMREYSASMTDLPIGFCLDTCHLLASGFDVASEAGLRHTVAEADRLLGLDNVRVIHANDSKAPLGSHVDRHENIGEGYIGLDGFRRILAHPGLRNKAFILETPVDKDGDDKRNLDTLKLLWRKRSTTTNKSS